MFVRRWQYASDWNAQGSSYSNATALDTTTNVSLVNHPAITSTTTITSADHATGAQTIGLLQPPKSPSGANVETLLIVGTSTPPSQGPAVLPKFFKNTGNTWTAVDRFAITATMGDSLTFQTQARVVEIIIGQHLQAGDGTQDTPPTPFQAGEPGMVTGLIRNGAVMSVTVDGLEQGPFDTYAGSAFIDISLDGKLHTVVVSHSGSYNPAVHPVSQVVSLVGSTIQANLILTPQVRATFQEGTWLIQAVTTNSFNMTFTDMVGNRTVLGRGLLVGTHYVSVVPGVDVYMQANTILSVNESATFSTDITELVISSIGMGTGLVMGAGSYTSSVIDALDPSTQWFLAEWDESPVWASARNSSGMTPALFTLSVGMTPQPDKTWTSITVPTHDVYLPVAAINRGLAGLASAPAGRYCQWVLRFPSTTVPTWMRDLSLYYWTPERDPFLLGKIPFGYNALPGTIMKTVSGTLNTFISTLRQRMIDFTSSYSIGGAVDKYLQAYGADLGYPQYVGEPPQSYRTRILTAFQSRQEGGSVPFICQQVAQLALSPTINGPNDAPLVTLTNGYASASWKNVTVTAGAGRSFTVTLPPPTSNPLSKNSYYPGLPSIPSSQAQPIIQNFISVILTPVGSVCPLSSIIFR